MGVRRRRIIVYKASNYCENSSGQEGETRKGPGLLFALCAAQVRLVPGS